MSSFSFILIVCHAIHLFLTLPIGAISPSAQTANVLVFRDTVGGMVLDNSDIMSLWRQRISIKEEQDPTWPFHLNFINRDIDSSNSIDRIINQTLLNSTFMAVNPINFIIGPSNPADMGMSLISEIAEQLQIPLLFGTVSFDEELNDQAKRQWNSSFFILPPPSFMLKNLVREVERRDDVKTFAYVAAPDSHSITECQGLSQQLEGVGVKTVLAHVLPMTAQAEQEMINFFTDLRDKYQPDIVALCNFWFILLPSSIELFGNPILQLKQLNYFPPAFVFDAAEFMEAIHPELAPDMLYTVSFAGSTVLASGLDFTEDSTPFSSEFRPTPEMLNASGSAINPLYQLMNDVGTHISKSPNSSSLQYFYSLWKSPTLDVQSAIVWWAAIDVMEAVLYKAADSAIRLGCNITSQLVLSYINGLQIPTPIGRVIFDSTGVNWNAQFVLTQLTQLGTVEVISPPELRTKEWIYPAPTWNERVYVRRYLTNPVELGAVAIFACFAAFMVSIGFTMFRHRDNPVVRILHWIHVCLMCLAAIIVSGAVTFLWTTDPNSAMCAACIWMIYIPMSFIVSLGNMKAYRLSVFLKNATIKAVVFRHSKVLLLAVLWTAFSAILLGISAIIDPVIASTVTFDSLRPSLNFHICATKDSVASRLLLFIGFFAHVACSVYCIYLVRNGVEGFRDGPMLKESFYLLYTILILIYGLHQAPISYSSLYSIRCVLVIVALSLFFTRLLGSRLFELWFPKAWQDRIKAVASFISQVMEDKRRVSNLMFQSADADSLADGPLYAKTGPDKQCVTEMLAALKDEERLSSFISFAKEMHSEDSILFCMAIDQLRLDLRHNINEALLNVAVPLCVLSAQSVYDKYVKPGSETEINIPSNTRQQIQKTIDSIKNSCSITANSSDTLRRLSTQSIPSQTATQSSISLIDECTVNMTQSMASEQTIRSFKLAKPRHSLEYKLLQKPPTLEQGFRSAANEVSLLKLEDTLKDAEHFIHQLEVCFDVACTECHNMMFQNLWSKFRGKETKELMQH